MARCHEIDIPDRIHYSELPKVIGLQVTTDIVQPTQYLLIYLLSLINKVKPGCTWEIVIKDITPW